MISSLVDYWQKMNWFIVSWVLLLKCLLIFSFFLFWIISLYHWINNNITIPLFIYILDDERWIALLKNTKATAKVDSGTELPRYYRVPIHVKSIREIFLVCLKLEYETKRGSKVPKGGTVGYRYRIPGIGTDIGSNVNGTPLYAADNLPEVFPDRTLLLPLERSVLRLNRLEGGRLKSERDPCETVEAGDSERSGPAGPGCSFQSVSVMDTTSGCGSLSWTSSLSSSGAGRGSDEGDGGTVFGWLCCAAESEGWRVFWRGGVGFTVDDGGVAGSGR